MTVVNMSNGKIPLASRFDALNWCVQNAPPAMLDAIKAGDEAKVMEVGTTAVITHPELPGWISSEPNIGFLRAAIADMHLLATGKLTPEKVKESMAAHAEFLSSAMQPAAPAAPAEPPTPPAPPADVPPAKEAVPTDPASPATPPTKDAAPDGKAPGKPRGRRAPPVVPAPSEG